MARYTEDVRTKLSGDQLARVRAAAREEGEPASEIVRKAVDRYVADPARRDQAAAIVAGIVERVGPIIRAEIERALDERAGGVAKAAAPLDRRVLDAIDERLSRAEAAAGV
jgi:hypothetical protein